MNKLKKHGGGESLYSCQFSSSVKNLILKITFEIKFAGNEFYTNSKFCENPCKNWMLWEFDVFEVFIQSSDKKSYFEFQISPLGQGFNLLILRPRIQYATPLKWQWSRNSLLEEGRWNGEISIDLKSIAAISDEGQFEKGEIFGNVHACLGKDQNREYYSLYLNNGEIADFHLPENFGPIC